MVPITQCDIALERRFAFYDQVHTTGMDIHHTPNARAVLTLGKDILSALTWANSQPHKVEL